jgi:hypothetical protein
MSTTQTQAAASVEAPFQTTTSFPRNLVTETGTVRCRFDAFVRLYPQAQQRFPGNQETFTYRGDKYTQDPAQMLRNLLRTVWKKRDGLRVIEINDNTREFGDVERKILRIVNGKVVRNSLHQYAELLKGYDLPTALQTPVKP